MKRALTANQKALAVTNASLDLVIKYYMHGFALVIEYVARKRSNRSLTMWISPQIATALFQPFAHCLLEDVDNMTNEECAPKRKRVGVRKVCQERTARQLSEGKCKTSSRRGLQDDDRQQKEEQDVVSFGRRRTCAGSNEGADGRRQRKPTEPKFEQERQRRNGRVLGRGKSERNTQKPSRGSIKSRRLQRRRRGRQKATRRRRRHDARPQKKLEEEGNWNTVSEMAEVEVGQEVEEEAVDHRTEDEEQLDQRIEADHVAQDSKPRHEGHRDMRAAS